MEVPRFLPDNVTVPLIEALRAGAPEYTDLKNNCGKNNFLKAVEENTAGKYDYIIANPPYVRTQIIGSDKAQEISNKLKLSGRVDMYFAFIICTNAVLTDDGITGYIMSQYVEQFPIPLYTTELAQEAIALVKKIIAGNNPIAALSYKKIG